MYVFSQWVVPKVFPRSLAFTTSLPSHLLPPLYLLPPLQNYLLQSWLFGFGLNPTSISLHWSHGLWLVYPPPPGPLLICNVARGSAPCLPGVNMVVSPGKNQNGSQMIVGQQVAEEESLPSSRGTPTPWLMLGSDFDLYLFLGCQSYIV